MALTLSRKLLSAMIKNRKKTMKAKPLITGMALAGALLVCASVAKANLQIGTGLNASGGLIDPGATEQNYAVSYLGASFPGLASGTTAIAYVEPQYPGAWIGNVTSGSALGQWISPLDPSTGLPSQQVGYFAYTLTINGAGTLSGKFASDNSGALFVDGNPVPVAYTAGWPTQVDTFQDYKTWVNFNATLNPGKNTIEFVVDNIAGDDPNGNPTGLIVAGTAAVSAVPEPTTLIAGALLLLPFGASTLRILRRRQVA